jgi:hypothetical protein
MHAIRLLLTPQLSQPLLYPFPSPSNSRRADSLILGKRTLLAHRNNTEPVPVLFKRQAIARPHRKSAAYLPWHGYPSPARDFCLYLQDLLHFLTLTLRPCFLCLSIVPLADAPLWAPAGGQRYETVPRLFAGIDSDVVDEHLLGELC